MQPDRFTTRLDENRAVEHSCQLERNRCLPRPHRLEYFTELAGQDNEITVFLQSMEQLPDFNHGLTFFLQSITHDKNYGPI